MRNDNELFFENNCSLDVIFIIIKNTTVKLFPIYYYKTIKKSNVTSIFHFCKVFASYNWYVY